MKRNAGNNGSSAGRLISHLAADKKKTIFAICLITLMLFMWIRVFLKKGPASAQAVSNSAVVSNQQKDSKPPVKVAFVELPVVQGRHDVISRDFFNSHDWEEFLDRNGGLNNANEVNIVSGYANTQEIKKVAEKLKLEAIWMGNNTQAYINNKLLKVADKLLISDGGKTYEFEVVSIKENEVVIRCEEAQVSLKLPQVTGNSK